MKKFNMIDEKFTCIECGAKVKPLQYTARDHCPQCLCSLHVDNNPGDRSCECHGILRPIGIEKYRTDEYKIIYKCDKCGQVKKNKMGNDDNFDKILELMVNIKSDK